jgi:hypothetical protein
MTSAELVASLAPPLRATLETHQADLLAPLTVPERIACRLLWPALLDRLPALLTLGLGVLATALNRLTVGQLVETVNDLAGTAHPTFKAAYRRGVVAR